MKLSEAYKELEISEKSTPEEAKKAFKKLAAKFHPDVNKDPSSESRFKKINEAYQCVQDGRSNEREMQSGWNPFHRQQVIELENINLYLNIDFKESVLGCKKEIKYSRQAKCQSCNGDGEIKLNNGCKKCNGTGQTTLKQGGMIFMTTCHECAGRSNTESCKNCNASGSTNNDLTMQVSIPAGIINGNVLRLQGMGNYAGSVMGVMDQYTDAHCHIKVEPIPGLFIACGNAGTSIYYWHQQSAS